jgi:hypothetical protein
MAIQKVHVFQKMHRYLVRPAYVIVRGGDVIHFVNHTPAAIEAVWPGVTPFRRVDRRDDRLRDARFGEHDDAVELTRGGRGVFHYTVYCAANSSFGEGESNPMVIVED